MENRSLIYFSQFISPMKYILFYIFENVFANFPINYYNSDNTLYYMYNFQLTK